ncbi:MAG TPA: beta-ketoacyl-ACP synthase III [Anaerolineae bacterium]|nr:beta-ketoacyl-ACP synthase III [Anaerolineae bacterium]
MGLLNGRITGWGAYAPEEVLTNFDLEQRLDTSDAWIVQRSGIRERHIAAEHETTASLAIKAATDALRRADLPADSLDLIIVATTTPDYLTPPVSSQIQHALGATDVPAFVLETGCTGFVYSLATAYQFIATGAYKTILVIGVELLSRHINWEDRSTAVLFGDAAGAVVIEATEEACGMRGFVLGSDGSQAHQIIVPAGGTAEPPNGDALAGGRHYIHMNGREVFKFATRVVGRASRQAVAKAGMSMDEIDWIIPHQANLRIIQSAAREMNLPLDRFVVNIENYGNTSAASIPLALTENLESGRIKPDDNLLLVSFGAGLTWGALVLQMEPS